MSVYAVSDLHGRLDLYQKIKEFIKPEDKVICLGDCGDRGPQGWETIKAVAKDPQFIYLMGNHEEMLAITMMDMLEDSRISHYYQKYPNPLELLCYNGGGSTIDGWINDGSNPGWINYLINLPRSYTYVSKETGIEIYLCHAGFTPGTTVTDYDMIWSRDHFQDIWPKDFETTIIVHGHTPCYYLSKKLNRIAPEDVPILYADDHKICIDMGSADTGITCLFDLDAFEAHIISVEKQ